MSILSISSLYNRFSHWAQKQPQIKMEKLFSEIENCIHSFDYKRSQDGFVKDLKALVSEGAVIDMAQLQIAIKSEGWGLRWSDGKPKLVEAILASGVVPDDSCFESALRRDLGCFKEQLTGDSIPSVSMTRYALICHGHDAELVAGIFDRNPVLNADVLSAAVGSPTLRGEARLAVIKKITAAGVTPKARSIEYAVRNFDEADVALHLLDAGAPATVEAMIYAIDRGKQDIARKLYEKGCSFDETLAQCPVVLQGRVKAYRKIITGEVDNDDRVIELQQQVQELTARLEKLEGGAAPKAKPAPAAKPAAKA